MKHFSQFLLNECNQVDDLEILVLLVFELGLEFLGFELDAPQTIDLFKQQHGNHALSDLDKWHQFESEHPDTFIQMYQFWVRKDVV